MKIAVVAPSRSLPRGSADRLLSLQKQHQGLGGLSINFHDQCFLSSGHFAGTDEERAAALIEVANDPAVDAVWFARGGYGSGRLLSLILPALGEAANRKTYLGYSDTGYLLAGLAARGIGESAHAPLVNDGERPGGEKALLRVLRWLAQQDEGTLEPSLTPGQKAYAFNLTILASLAATHHLPQLDGSLLMIEETDEHLYAIDRMLMTSFASGKLDHLSGLRCGRMSGIPENDIPFGQEAEDVVRFWCDRHGVPYLGRADIGHDAANKIVPFPFRG